MLTYCEGGQKLDHDTVQVRYTHPCGVARSTGFTRGFQAVYRVVAGSGARLRDPPWFIAREAQFPFRLTVLGVVGGAIAFGLLDIFLGPVLPGIAYVLRDRGS